MYKKQILRALVAFSVAILLIGSALAFTPDSGSKKVTSQAGTLLNSHVTGATDTAVVATLTGVPNQAAHVYSIDAVCSTGTSGITIADAAVTKFATLAAGVTTTRLRVTWAIPLTGATGNTVTITLATCGSGNTGTLTVQADQY